MRDVGVALLHASLLGATIAVGLLVAPPLDPVVSLGPLAVALGIACGVGLFVALAGRPIPLGDLVRAPKRRLFARSLALTLKSAQEEAVWRGVVLGLLIGSVGRGAAVALSTAAFAAAHAPRQGSRAGVHLLTGTLFGTTYVVTGSIVAAIGSHAAYNVLVGAGLLVDRRLSLSDTSDRDLARHSILAARDRPRPFGGRQLPTTRAPAPVASLHGARKTFGTVVALDGIDLELRPGEILALLGPNGAGKSTAVALMLGLRRPTAGHSTLFGGDPRDAVSRRQVGAVLQDVSFPPGLRVRDVANLVCAHFPHGETAAEALSRLGLASETARDAGGLSGGQRRRLAVALALIGKPKALFLDEPTAGMDANARRSLLADIVRFAEEGGAVLLTTQQLAEAEEIASRVVLLTEGRILVEGTVADMRARAGLARVTLRAPSLPAIDGVVSTYASGDRHVVYVEDADAYVSALVRSGTPFSQLEVARSSLEDAFVTLTGEAIE